MRDELHNEGEMMEMWVEVDDILETQHTPQLKMVHVIMQLFH